MLLFTEYFYVFVIELVSTYVTKKLNPLEATASNNNSILKYALPIKNYNQQKLSSDLESPSVEKEATPRKLVPDNIPSQLMYMSNPL